MKIVVLGVSGMLGSMVWKFFSTHTSYELLGTQRTINNDDKRLKSFNAENFTSDELSAILSGCDYVINCIGWIKSRIDDSNSLDVERAITINSLFPHRLAAVAEKENVRVIQIATDCVYDGEKGHYVESDKHNALDVYGKTKSLGEVCSSNFLNLRCSIVGPELSGKKSLLEWFLNQPQYTKLKGFSNHLWNGVTTDAFARICYGMIKHNTWFSGFQNCVPADVVTKYQLLKIFSEVYGRSDIKISAFEAAPAINRSIATENSEKNLELWKNAGYYDIPTVKKMIEDMRLLF